MKTFLSCSLVVVAALTAFWPTLKHEFLVLDDLNLVAENPDIRNGFALDSIRWAFTAPDSPGGTPLARLSFRADYLLHGVRPEGFRWTGLLLHVVNSVFLLTALSRSTGACWRSLAVALLFAAHPMQVPTVAWISSRSILLATFFWILAFWVYTEYGKSGGLAWYLAAAVILVVGASANAMVVAAPLAFLAADVWPLGRLRLGAERTDHEPQRSEPANASAAESAASLAPARTPVGLLLEKAPLLLIAALTVFASTAWSASDHGDRQSLPSRFRGAVEGALVQSTGSLGRVAWPSAGAGIGAQLELVDPHRSVWRVAASAALLTALTAGVVLLSRRRRVLVFGWFWYLAPMLAGAFESGSGRFLIDRYAYLAVVGLFVAVVWIVADFATDLRIRGAWSAALVGVVVIGLVATSRAHLRLWKDTETLFARAAETGRHRWAANYVLALDWARRGEIERAVRHVDAAGSDARAQAGNSYELTRRCLRSTIELDRSGYLNLGIALAAAGRLPAAIAFFENVVRVDPNRVDAQYDLGIALSRANQFARARDAFIAAVRLAPGHVDARYNLGVIEATNGRIDEAVDEFEAVLALNRKHVAARFALGATLLGQGRPSEAAEAFQAVLETDPDHLEAIRRLAWLLATASDGSVRDGAEAVRLAERACEATNFADPNSLDTLAAAFAETGRFAEAVATCRKAVALATAGGKNSQASEYRRHLGKFRAGRALRERSAR